MSRNGEHGVRDPRIPRNAEISRDVRTAVDVPEASEVSVVTWFLSPRCVGDHVTVLSQEGLEDLEDPGMTDSPLDDTAPIEHLVTKWGRFLGGIPSLVWRIFCKYPLDIGAERCELFSPEDTLEHDITL